MKFPSLPLGVMLLLFSLAGHVAASDGMVIYSDRFHNGWSDNWSWLPRYSTNNPVFTGITADTNNHNL